jgi:hypothetical protein
MTNVTESNFGLLVAYVLPGFVVLLGLAAYSETVRHWLTAGGSTQPTVGGFLYVTLASVTLGLIVSTVRWGVLDRLHHATGVRAPKWNFRGLDQKLPAFELLVESHYRYYQFYGNALVASAIAFGAWRIAKSAAPQAIDAAFALFELLLLAGSRDTLRKYYGRVEQLLSS